MAPVPLVVPWMFQPKEAVVNQRFTYMLCEINLDRANFVIPLLFKLSNILAILLDTWTLTTNAIKRNFNWKKKTTTQKSTEKHDKRSDGIDHEMALISNFGALFDFWKLKKKWRDFSLWKTTQQPDGAMWQMSLDLFVKEFGRLKKDKGTRDWRVSLRLRPWADWQVTSRRRQSTSRSGGGGARESHSSARWPISVLIRRFPFEKKFKISRQNLKKFAPKNWGTAPFDGEMGNYRTAENLKKNLKCLENIFKFGANSI